MDGVLNSENVANTSTFFGYKKKESGTRKPCGMRVGCGDSRTSIGRLSSFCKKMCKRRKKLNVFERMAAKAAGAATRKWH
jgi:hypothetical protein